MIFSYTPCEPTITMSCHGLLGNTLPWRINQFTAINSKPPELKSFPNHIANNPPPSSAAYQTIPSPGLTPTSPSYQSEASTAPPNYVPTTPSWKRSVPFDYVATSQTDMSAGSLCFAAFQNTPSTTYRSPSTNLSPSLQVSRPIPRPKPTPTPAPTPLQLAPLPTLLQPTPCKRMDTGTMTDYISVNTLGSNCNPKRKRGRPKKYVGKGRLACKAPSKRKPGRPKKLHMTLRGKFAKYEQALI